MNDLINHILQKMPIGAVAFNQKMEIIFCNKQAEQFYKRFEQPEEIEKLCSRLFNAIKNSTLEIEFPGEIYLYKKLKDSPSNWIFRLQPCSSERLCVCMFITEESLSNKLNMNKIRDKYRLTRRETDVLRRVLNGLKNTEIGEELSISEQTVKDHLSNVYLKTGTKHRMELMGFLLNSGESISL